MLNTKCKTMLVCCADPNTGTEVTRAIGVGLQGLEWDNSYTAIRLDCPYPSYVKGVSGSSVINLDSIGPLACSNGNTVGPPIGNPNAGKPWSWSNSNMKAVTSVGVRWYRDAQDTSSHGISRITFPDLQGYGGGNMINGGAGNLSCPVNFVVAGFQAWVDSNSKIVALGLTCRSPDGRAVIQPLYGGCLPPIFCLLLFCLKGGQLIDAMPG